MKSWRVLSSALCAAGLSVAQTQVQPMPVGTPPPAQGVVLSTSPIVQQVPVSRQVCSHEQVTVVQPKSGAGAVLGSIAGGAIGNAAGHGSGAATVLGAIGGAVVGDQIETAPAAQTQTVQRCSVQTFYENRTVAYRVVYVYANQQYTVQMPYDPGPTIALQIQPAQVSVPVIPVQEATVTTTVQQPSRVVVSTPTPFYYYLFGFPFWGPGGGGGGGPHHAGPGRR